MSTDNLQGHDLVESAILPSSSPLALDETLDLSASFGTLNDMTLQRVIPPRTTCTTACEGGTSSIAHSQICGDDDYVEEFLDESLGASLPNSPSNAVTCPEQLVVFNRSATFASRSRPSVMPTAPASAVAAPTMTITVSGTEQASISRSMSGSLCAESQPTSPATAGNRHGVLSVRDVEGVPVTAAILAMASSASPASAVQLTTVPDEHEELKKRLAEALAEKGTLRDEVRTLRGDIAKLASQADESVARAQKQLTEAQQSAANMRAECDALMDSMKEIRNERDALRRKLAASEAQVKKMLQSEASAIVGDQGRNVALCHVDELERCMGEGQARLHAEEETRQPLVDVARHTSTGIGTGIEVSCTEQASQAAIATSEVPVEVRLEAQLNELRRAHACELSAQQVAGEKALSEQDEKHAAAMAAQLDSLTSQQEVAVRLATASAESLARSREEALESARALHQAEVTQLKALQDSLTAQREKQFAELLALEKERQRHEMADAKALLEAGLSARDQVPVLP